MSNEYLNHYGCKFKTDVMSNEKHSLENYGMYPIGRLDIGSPKPKTKYVDIPGASGSLDLTTALVDYVTYQDRKGKFKFRVFGERSHCEGIYRAIMNEIHGRWVKVTRDDEPDVYLEGRITVGSMTARDRGSADIPMDCTFEPYKYEVTDTVTPWLWDPFNFLTGVIRDYADITVSGTKNVTVVSSAAGGSPEFIASTAMTMRYDGKTYNLAAGSNTFAEIELPHAVQEVTFTFTGTGTVSIKFRGGVL